jgi:uncharacterized membrane protein
MIHNQYGATGLDAALTNNVEATPLQQFSTKWLVDSWQEAVMLVSVILNAAAGGIIFIFSNTIMPSLGKLDADVGIEAMNTINTLIVNPSFIFFFFGGLISAIPARNMWVNKEGKYSDVSRYYALASTLVFFFGEFMVTVTQNVPRNNALLVVDPESEEGADYWQNEFIPQWVAWNTARGTFAIISSVIGALCLRFMAKS